MEVRDVITLVLGSNFIIAVATFLATFLTTRMQVQNSAKQFEKEFEKSNVVYQRERKREIRSEPLLKLRTALGHVASIYNQRISAVDALKTLTGSAKEQAQQRLAELNKDWSTNSLAELQIALFIQSDTELFNKVLEILDRYNNVMNVIALPTATIETQGKIWPKVIEIQEIINKRLEEL